MMRQKKNGNISIKRAPKPHIFPDFYHDFSRLICYNFLNVIAYEKKLRLIQSDKLNTLLFGKNIAKRKRDAPMVAPNSVYNEVEKVYISEEKIEIYRIIKEYESIDHY